MSREILLPNLEIYKIKNDSFRKERGGSTEIYKISCSQCNTDLLVYQKDGKGSLHRCYLDRIAWPPTLVLLQQEIDIHKIPNMNCVNCRKLIATPIIYLPEKRLAYSMIPGSFKKEQYCFKK